MSKYGDKAQNTVVKDVRGILDSIAIFTQMENLNGIKTERNF